MASAIPDRAPMSFWQQFISCQMTHNMDALVRDSIKDFHAPGFNYICFQFTPWLTVRLYVTFPDDNFNTGVINIRDHLYDSSMLCLVGGFRNAVFEERENLSGKYHCHLLTSALHPDNKDREIKLEYERCVDLEMVSVKAYQPGDHHFQAASEIHMVTTVPVRMNAFMIWEFPTHKERSRIYTCRRMGGTLPTPGAYNRYDSAEIREILTEVIRQMNKGH